MRTFIEFNPQIPNTRTSLVEKISQKSLTTKTYDIVGGDA